MCGTPLVLAPPRAERQSLATGSLTRLDPRAWSETAVNTSALRLLKWPLFKRVVVTQAAPSHTGSRRRQETSSR